MEENRESTGHGLPASLQGGPSAETDLPASPEEVREIPQESVAMPKKTIVLFPTVILMILISVFAGYLIYQNIQLKKQVSQLTSQIPTPTLEPSPLPTADPTADWKTYTNQKYGFEIKYPVTWYYQDCDTETTLILNPLEMPICETEPYDPIIIGVNPNVKTISAFKEAWKKVGFRATQEETLNFEAQKFLIEKIEAAPGPEKFKVIALPLNLAVFEITIYDLSQEQVADQILSTFRFTE